MSSSSVETPVSRHFFFEGFAPSHLKNILLHASGRHFDPGSFLFREHEWAKEFYLISKGKVAIGLCGEKEKSLIQTVGANEVLGWSWMVPPFYWRFDAWALEPTQVIAFDAIALRELSQRDHEFGYVLVSKICELLAERLEKLRFGTKFGLHSKKSIRGAKATK
jgi:CRP/FNR family transcriptional regulator, cyclic AMP receptor protein